MKKIVLSALALAVATGCTAQNSAQEPAHEWVQGQEYNLTILHTNDNHGNFWQNKYGERGMAARATLINEIRAEVQAEGGSVLLLSGGDINTGVPESDLQDAEPDFIGMNMLGYDAMAVGNHEFDNPLDVLAKQEGWAEFPFLAANIYKDGKRMFDAYKIFNKQGIKIAVIGLTTEDTAKIGNPEYIDGVEFKDPKEEAKQVIAELKSKHNPDVIIAATHMGHYQDGQHGSNAAGDVKLARYLNEGDLDMIVGGHSQEPVCMEGPNMYSKNFHPGDACQPDQQNGTWIVQAHEWGKYVGRADYTFKNGEFALKSYDLIPVNLKKKIKVDGKKVRVFIQDEIPQDKAVFDTLKPFQDKGQAALNVKIGTSNGDLVGERKIVRNNQTNLGRLIATAHKERAKADFAVMNSGGVRASIAGGDITYKDVLTVQPFGNIVTYVDMTGAEVQDYLNVVGTKSKDSGAYAQFSGITMTVNGDKVTDVKIDGKALNVKDTYRFTIPSFNAAGGDGYPNITQHPAFVNTGYVDAEVLKDFIESKGNVDVTEFQPNDEIVYK